MYNDHLTDIPLVESINCHPVPPEMEDELVINAVDRSKEEKGTTIPRTRKVLLITTHEEVLLLLFTGNL